MEYEHCVCMYGVYKSLSSMIQPKPVPAPVILHILFVLLVVNTLFCINILCLKLSEIKGIVLSTYCTKVYGLRSVTKQAGSANRLSGRSYLQLIRIIYLLLYCTWRANQISRKLVF